MKANIPILLILFSILLSSCVEDQNKFNKEFELLQKNNFFCDKENNLKGCIEKFPEIKGPFSSEDMKKASIIIGKYFCLSREKTIDSNLKELVLGELIKEDVDTNLVNSYKVIKTAYKISNLMDKSCELNNNEN